jgi:hypothetical protein
VVAKLPAHQDTWPSFYCRSGPMLTLEAKQRRCDPGPPDLLGGVP